MRHLYKLLKVQRKTLFFLEKIVYTRGRFHFRCCHPTIYCHPTFCLYVFSCDCDSRIANVRLSVTKTPQPLTIAPINHGAYLPLCLSTIKPINLWSSFATFKPFGLFTFISCPNLHLNIEFFAIVSNLLSSAVSHVMFE